MPSGAFFVWNTRFWCVRKSNLEKLSLYPHFRTDNKSPKTFEQGKTLQNQHKTALTGLFIQYGYGVRAKQTIKQLPKENNILKYVQQGTIKNAIGKL